MVSICPVCKKIYKNYNSVHSHISLKHRNEKISNANIKTIQPEPKNEQPLTDTEIKPINDTEIPMSTIEITQNEQSKNNELINDIPINPNRIQIPNNTETKTDDTENTAIDITELNSVPADLLNDYFKSKRLNTLSTEEYDKLTTHSGVMFKKRIPNIVFKYGDIVNVLLSGGKIVYKRVNQANEIVALRKKYQEDMEKKNKEMIKETKKEPEQKKDDGYSGEELLALQKKYNLIK